MGFNNLRKNNNLSINHDRIFFLRKISKRYWFRESLLGYAMILPMLVVMVGIMAYPAIWAIWLSLYNRKLGLPTYHFIGLGNYAQLIKDPLFLSAAYNTLLFTLVAVSLKFLLGMISALLLNMEWPALNFLRSWMILPWIAPTIVVALTWQWMFADLGGILNYIFRSAGIIKQNISWLGNPNTAKLAILVANVWLGFPFFGMNFLAGMQSIPEELYEAAQIDGASQTQRFWHVTIPGLAPVITITTLLNTIWTINIFDLVYVMTGGGPSGGTLIIGVFAYQRSFIANNLSYGIAASVIFAPLVSLLILMVLRHFQIEESEENE
jgi:multiple sugar transport system permease protein